MIITEVKVMEKKGFSEKILEFTMPLFFGIFLLVASVFILPIEIIKYVSKKISDKIMIKKTREVSVNVEDVIAAAEVLTSNNTKQSVIKEIKKSYDIVDRWMRYVYLTNKKHFMREYNISVGCDISFEKLLSELVVNRLVDKNSITLEDIKKEVVDVLKYIFDIAKENEISCIDEYTVTNIKSIIEEKNLNLEMDKIKNKHLMPKKWFK